MTEFARGVEGFVEGLKRCGCDPEERNDVIVFNVVPAGGARAGRAVETGVGLDELSGWPMAPPHWLHFPASINIANTNSKPSPIPNWLKHSRKADAWGNAEEPAQAWIAHVRAVLEDS